MSARPSRQATSSLPRSGATATPSPRASRSENLLFELFGASTGCCRGKGGSMHVGDMQKGMVPGIAIVGGGIPLAAGMALALKMQKSPGVVACFFGDGAVAEGAFHEGVNLAAIWDLPVLFVCENNLYGASTRVDLVMRNPRIADRGAAYGIRGETVDGNDVLAVYEAARSAAGDCRQRPGAGLARALDLSPHRPLPPRRVPLSGQGRTRRMVCPRPDRAAGATPDRTRSSSGPADLDHVRTETQRGFQAAVELARPPADAVTR